MRDRTNENRSRSSRSFPSGNPQTLRRRHAADSPARALHPDVVDVADRAHARQVTAGGRGHVIANSNVWSPDGRWVVYDVRSGDDFDGDRIEQVDVVSGSVELLYESKKGGGCGIVTFNPAWPEVAFVVGPERPALDWHYGFTRRHGVTVETARPGAAIPIEAANYAPPFVPGALRGGSHLHSFSDDGGRIAFTYEDDVLAGPGKTVAGGMRRRDIAIGMRMGRLLRVNGNHPRNRPGNFFCAVVTRTVAHPRPGSDEIVRALEEGWIGREGYLRADGSRQRWAIAFQGAVMGRSGRIHSEVFVVDLPDGLATPGNGCCLEGTQELLPGPPLGALQRRVTFTDGRRHPGVAAAPRHWLRSSPSGDRIAFLLADDAGVPRLHTVSPNGGEPVAVAPIPWAVSSAFTWSPGGRLIAFVADHSVFVSDVETGRSYRLTRREPEAAPLALSCCFAPHGRAIAFLKSVRGVSQIFIVDVPELP